MKKLLCLCLALVCLCMFVSCGPGGDTNMHKIMKAMDDGEIGTDLETDVYHYKSSNTFQSGDNEDFTEVRALATGHHYRHRVDFAASKFVVVESTSKTYLELDINWWVEAEERQLFNNEMQSINANSISVDVKYTVEKWDSSRSDFIQENVFKALLYNIDMNAYYENGEFSVEDATVEGDSGCEAVAIDLLNEAFEKLNEMYSAKGYPIK
ncbi:MAG: hypothetical protein IJV72_02175 [Clostridia bacterium]|nr:hypothetical protein [Clostridia bacterium]